MSRNRDIANVLSKSTSIALDSEVGLVPVTPTSIAATGGTGSISTTGAVSFTTCTAISLNDVFNATYENYKILFKGVGSTTVECRFRLRVDGVDNSTANSYNIQRFTVSDSTLLGVRSAATSGWFGVITSTAPNTFSADIFNPFLAVPTGFISHNFRNNSNAQIEDYYSQHNQSTSYDSINIIAHTGNFTGTVSVYGYRN